MPEDEEKIELLWLKCIYHESFPRWPDGLKTYYQADPELVNQGRTNVYKNGYFLQPPIPHRPRGYGTEYIEILEWRLARKGSDRLSELSRKYPNTN